LNAIVGAIGKPLLRRGERMRVPLGQLQAPQKLACRAHHHHLATNSLTANGCSDTVSDCGCCVASSAHWPASPRLAERSPGFRRKRYRAAALRQTTASTSCALLRRTTAASKSGGRGAQRTTPSSSPLSQNPPT